MSPTAFANLRLERPKLQNALEGLRKWAAINPAATFLDPRRLAGELDYVDPTDLSATLTLLINYGRLERVYKLIAPTNGVLADATFSSPKDVPERLRDSAEDWFSTRDAVLVIVFREAEHD